MTTIDIHHESGTSSGSESADDDAVAAEAAEEAKQVVATARYEAFGLVTEARREAESILDEAHAEAAGIVHQAKLQAESIVDAARLSASDFVPSDIDPEDHAALEAEHDALTERVSTLRALAEQLEERFDALTEQADKSAAEQAAIVNDRLTDVHAPSAAPVLDYSPAVDSDMKVDEEDSDPADSNAEKGSFYNRRSAKLPRIGEEGGRGALDMMRTIRNAFEES